MAVRNAQQTWMQKGVSRTIWSGLLNTDTGSPESGAALADRNVQVLGTFGAGGSVRMMGSNDLVTWSQLTDNQGNAIILTAAGMEQIQENPFYIRPEVTAGDGATSLTVVLIAHGVY